jgi:hypothetical protein
MNRLLITLLALLTGLVAQVSPAAAVVRAGGQTEIGVLAAHEGQLRKGATVVIDQTRVADDGTARIAAAPVLTGGSELLPPAVMIGIDRARE